MTVRPLLSRLSGRLPLNWVAWLYNLRRLPRVLVPYRRYPLVDHAGVLSNQPLLFVSAGRSGTTLLRSMLVMNGQIAIPPESFAISYAALQYAAMQEQSWYNLTRMIVSLFEGVEMFSLWETDLQPVYVRARNLPPEERSLARVIDLVFLRYAELHFPDAIIWGDQSPQNALRLPWVAEVFPQGRYLHILRDGRDVVASYYVQDIPLDTAIQRWKNSVEAAQALQKRLPSTCYLEIRYEDLVKATEAVLQKVCAFAGIQYDANMLNYWQSSTTIENPFYEQWHQNLKRPVFTKPIGRWRERLTPEQQERVTEQLGSLLENYGYM